MRPRRSPGSIRRWPRNWGWATTKPPLLRQKRKIPNTACRAPTCRPTPQAASAVSAGWPASSRWINCCARAAPNSRDEAASGKVWTPHRPPRPEKSEGGKRLVIKSEFEPQGDQPNAIKDLVEGVKRHDRTQVLLGRHRLGQNLHHGQGDRGDAAPGADSRAEQDAGRAALRRVQVVLPRQRGGIFRLLLRLLPAGGLRPAHRHLYREGILHQRADRPHAPLGDARAARTRRRRHRRLGLVHLRHRLGGNLLGDDLHPQAGRQDRPAPAARRPGGAAIQAHAGRLLPRLVPRARRRGRNLPGALRGPRLARVAVRRRDRDRFDEIRPAHRAKDRRTRIRQDLRQLALRHAAPDADPGHLRHQERAQRPSRPAQRRRPPVGSAAPRTAHGVRPGNDGSHRLLRRHRELFALSHRPQAGRAAADFVRIRAGQRAGLCRREPRHHPAARRHVPRRLPPQGDARRIRLPPALLHGQPPAYASRNGTPCGRRPWRCRPRPATGR